MDIRAELEQGFPALKYIKETREYVDGFTVQYEITKYKGMTFYSYPYNMELTNKIGRSKIDVETRLAWGNDYGIVTAVGDKVRDYRHQLCFEGDLLPIIQDTHKCILEKPIIKVRDFFQTISYIQKTYVDKCKLAIIMSQPSYDEISKEFYSDMHFDELLIINSEVPKDIVEVVNLEELFYHVKTKAYQGVQQIISETDELETIISRYEQIDCKPNSVFWEISLV